MPDQRNSDGGQWRTSMNWCHMCRRWSEVTESAYFCLACLDDWSAAYIARREQEESAEKQ